MYVNATVAVYFISPPKDAPFSMEPVIVLRGRINLCLHELNKGLQRRPSDEHAYPNSPQHWSNRTKCVHNEPTGGRNSCWPWGSLSSSHSWLTLSITMSSLSWQACPTTSAGAPSCLHVWVAICSAHRVCVSLVLFGPLTMLALHPVLGYIYSATSE